MWICLRISFVHLTFDHGPYCLRILSQTVFGALYVTLWNSGFSGVSMFDSASSGKPCPGWVPLTQAVVFVKII